MIRRLLIIAVLSLFSCKSKENVSKEFAAADIAASLSYAQVYNYLLSNNGLVGNSAKKSASKLTFSFIQAGIQTDEYGQYLRLFFHADLDRDYIEVARCDGGKKKTNKCLFDKDLQSGNLLTADEINKILNSDKDYSHLTSTHLNNCWNELTKGCTIIGEASTVDDEIVAVHKITAGDTFIDLTAPRDTDVYYIARVCIDQGRIDERESSNQACSHVFRSTDTVKITYDNERTNTKSEVIKKLGALSAELNYMTQRGHELSSAIIKGLDICEKRGDKHKRAKNVRDSIAVLAGIGIGIGASISTFGWKDVKNMGAGADAGKALGAAFADVFRSVNDYPRRSCPEVSRPMAEIVKLMGHKSSPDELLIGQGAYLYQDKLKRYYELSNEYMQIDANYIEWFHNACYIANVRQNQQTDDRCN